MVDRLWQFDSVDKVQVYTCTCVISNQYPSFHCKWTTHNTEQIPNSCSKTSLHRPDIYGALGVEIRLLDSYSTTQQWCLYYSHLRNQSKTCLIHRKCLRRTSQQNVVPVLCCVVEISGANHCPLMLRSNCQVNRPLWSAETRRNVNPVESFKCGKVKRSVIKWKKDHAQEKNTVCKCWAACSYNVVISASDPLGMQWPK